MREDPPSLVYKIHYVYHSFKACYMRKGIRSLPQYLKADPPLDLTTPAETLIPLRSFPHPTCEKLPLRQTLIPSSLFYIQLVRSYPYPTIAFLLIL